MATIQFDLSVAAIAQEALNDNLAFEDMIQAYSDVFEFPEFDDEDDKEQYIVNVKYQLNAWGISEENYEINE